MINRASTNTLVDGSGATCSELKEIVRVDQSTIEVTLTLTLTLTLTRTRTLTLTLTLTLNPNPYPNPNPNPNPAQVLCRTYSGCARQGWCGGRSILT